MSRAVRLLAALALLVGLSPLVPRATADPPLHETGFVPVAVGTPDETLLHYKVILPGPPEDGPYPAVIDYSGYQPAINIYDGLDDRFLEAGYAVVGLNIRGSSCSGGKFDYFEPRQSVDGVEAIDWLAERDWSNGQFGMVGKSYPGITQLFVAGARAIPDDELGVLGTNLTQEEIEAILADHLEVIVPGHVFADLYRDVPFPGGILNLTFSAGWSAQRNIESFLVGPAYYLQQDFEVDTGETDGEVPQEVKDQCLRNQAGHAPNPIFNPFVQGASDPRNHYDSEFFHVRSPWYFAHELGTPMMLVESWQDEQVGSRATHILEQIDPDLDWKFVATNGDHGEYYGDHVFAQVLAFVNRYMPPAAGFATTTTPFVDGADRVLLLWENGAGGERNPSFATTHPTWPVATTVERLFLTPDGGLSPSDDAPGSASYTYTPGVGAQARGGYDLAGEPIQADWQQRPPDGTSLSFTSEPLAADMVLAGPASLDLWLSSTAADTDLEVTLSEIRPDGTQERFVQQGWLRASHRVEDPDLSTEVRPYQVHTIESVAPLVPTEPTAMRVEIFPFGHVFRAGSRIRVTVAAPHVLPDLWGFAGLPVPAVNTIHTGPDHPSSLALPLVEGVAVPADPGVCVLRNQPCRTEPPA